VSLYATLWNVIVLKQQLKTRRLLYTTHFKSASSSRKVNTLNILYKNCMVWQLLKTITKTINTFLVVNFLKCVVTEVVLLSVVAFKTLDISQGSVATHLRCGGIFSDTIITNFLLILTVKNVWKSVNIWRSYKTYKKCSKFLDHPVDLHVVHRVARKQWTFNFDFLYCFTVQLLGQLFVLFSFVCS